jgi:hypothetical protein
VPHGLREAFLTVLYNGPDPFVVCRVHVGKAEARDLLKALRPDWRTVALRWAHTLSRTDRVRWGAKVDDFARLNAPNFLHRDKHPLWRLVERAHRYVEQLRAERTTSTHANATDAPQTDQAVAPEGACDAGDTWPTMRDLASAAGISDDTFRRVRNAAGIEVKLKGARARDRRYVPNEVDRLIGAARDGNFIERTGMIEKWAQWGSKKAASRPHGRK